MYDELIRSLRCCADYPCYDCKFRGIYMDSCDSTLKTEAANAIEKMNRRETPMKITEIHVDEYYCPACGAENNCDQGYVQDAYCPACGQRLLSEPPKEE